MDIQPQKFRPPSPRPTRFKNIGFFRDAKVLACSGLPHISGWETELKNILSRLKNTFQKSLLINYVFTQLHKTYCAETVALGGSDVMCEYMCWAHNMKADYFEDLSEDGHNINTY